MPLFSIITVCYNAEKTIEKTLESVYMQSLTNFEHIIQDGGSKDKTLEMVKNKQEHYKINQLKIFSEPDEGIYDAMNKGIEKVEGEFICFMNSGDIFENHHVLESVSNIIKEKKADLYYGNAAIAYPNGSISHQIIYNAESQNDLLSRLENGKGRMPCHQAIFASRKCFENNMFDKKYKLRAELNWFLKCVFNNMIICNTRLLVCKNVKGGCSDKVDNIVTSETEINDILNTYHFGGKNKKVTWGSIETKVKNHILEDWFVLRGINRTLAAVLERHQTRNIAIYGCGVLGNHLYQELENTNIKVQYFIDKQIKDSCLGVDVLSFQTEWPLIDIIVITPLVYFEAIKKEISNKVKYPVISLEELLEEAWSTQV